MEDCLSTRLRETNGQLLLLLLLLLLLFREKERGFLFHC